MQNQSKLIWLDHSNLLLNFNRLELDFYMCYDRTSYSIKRVRHSIIRFLVMLWWIILVFFWQTNTLQQYITRRSNSLSKMIKSARFIGPVQVSWVIICSWGYFYDDIMDVLSVDGCYLKDTKLGCPKNQTGSGYNAYSNLRKVKLGDNCTWILVSNIRFCNTKQFMHINY